MELVSLPNVNITLTDTLTELWNLPRCLSLSGDTDAPSVITSTAEESPSVADSAASFTDALVGIVP